MPETNSKHWMLEMGIRSGFQWQHHYKQLPSLDAAKETANQWEKDYLSLGVQSWYMTAIAPDGVHVVLSELCLTLGSINANLHQHQLDR